MSDTAMMLNTEARTHSFIFAGWFRHSWPYLLHILPERWVLPFRGHITVSSCAPSLGE